MMRIRDSASRLKSPRFKRLNKIQKYYWWDPPEDSMKFDYLRNSSLHGLKYIGQPNRHLVERIFWLLAFLSGVTVAVILIQNVFHKYITNPVIVSFQPFETLIDEIPFPAITICNMNKVLKSKAMKYIRNARSDSLNEDSRRLAMKDLYYLDHVCSSTKSFSKKFNFSLMMGTDAVPILDHTDDFGERSDVKDFLSRASQSCYDMLELCVWHEDVIGCREAFKPIETDFGKCCTFNMVPPTLLDTLKNDTRDDPIEVHEWANWNVAQEGLFLTKEYSFKFPRRQMRAGKSFGLSFLLNPAMNEYFCTTSDSTGFRMVAHLPIEFPQVVDFGIAIRPTSEVFVGIRPEIVMSEASIAGFPLEKRECYFPGEYLLQYYNYYTASNCINECIANETFKQCACVTYYMPRDDTRDLCGPNKFLCARAVKRAFSEGGQKTSCGSCLPSCTEIRYLMEVTETPLQSEQELWLDEQKRPASWVGSNVSIVHVYFCQDSTYARLRKELYGITDLIANTGGLMGLCLGFSGLSLIEILYYLTLRAWCRTQRKDRQPPMLARAAGKLQKIMDAWLPNGNGGGISTLRQRHNDTSENRLGLNFYPWELNPRVSELTSLPSIGLRDQRLVPQWGESPSANSEQGSSHPMRAGGQDTKNSRRDPDATAHPYSGSPFWNVV